MSLIPSPHDEVEIKMWQLMFMYSLGIGVATLYGNVYETPVLRVVEALFLTVMVPAVAIGILSIIRAARRFATGGFFS